MQARPSWANPNPNPHPHPHPNPNPYPNQARGVPAIAAVPLAAGRGHGRGVHRLPRRPPTVLSPVTLRLDAAMWEAAQAAGLTPIPTRTPTLTRTPSPTLTLTLTLSAGGGPHLDCGAPGYQRACRSSGRFGG